MAKFTNKGDRVEVISDDVKHWDGKPVARGTMGTVTDVDGDSVYVSLDTDNLGFAVEADKTELDYADPLEISTFLFDEHFKVL